MHIIDRQLICLEAVKPNRREGGELSGHLEELLGLCVRVCVYVCKRVRVCVGVNWCVVWLVGEWSFWRANRLGENI